jgi:hypothetical protein
VVRKRKATNNGSKVPLDAFLSRHKWRQSLAGNIRPNEGMVSSILHNRDKLVPFLTMIRSSLSNIQDSIQYLVKELEDAPRWTKADIEFCASLWANLHTVCISQVISSAFNDLIGD